MRVLVACEFSGMVRDAFIRKGHDAMSCDFRPSLKPGPHYQGDVLDILNNEWDLLIAHPPCTHLATSGARWFKYKEKEQKEAIAFFKRLLYAPIRKRAIENPIGIISSVIKPPDQIIQPWQFRHPETKATCLWLYGLPLLKPTYIVEGRSNRMHMMPGGHSQAMLRSITYAGIAWAMSEQWG